MANLRKIPAIKFFRIAHQIHKGYASLFVKPFSSRLLQISTMFNCRFKDNCFCFGFIGGDFISSWAVDKTRSGAKIQG